jgi:DNA-binding transcriptional ArsR family regulator
VSVAPILAALGDESRLQIVRKLCKGGPLSIKQARRWRRYLAKISAQWDDALSRLQSAVEK